MSETLVLLPGMMCDERLFAPQIDYFGQSISVMVPDYGMATTITAMAHEVLKKTPEQFALAGLSMGGIVAMEVIRLAPKRVTHLALLDTNPRAELEAVKQARETQIAAVQKGGLSQIMQEQMINRYFSTSSDSETLAEICLTMALDLGREAFVRQSIALQSRPDQQDSLRHVQVPTVILVGREDQLCPLDRHQLLQQLIPHAELIIVPDAGHITPLEQPALINQILENWLAT